MQSLIDIRARLEAGTLTPAGALDLCREAIAAREPALRAFVAVDESPVVPARGPLAVTEAETTVIVPRGFTVTGRADGCLDVRRDA